MIKKNTKKLEEIENNCLNNDQVEIYEKAIIEAKSQSTKSGTHFVGMVRRLVEW